MTLVTRRTFIAGSSCALALAGVSACSGPEAVTADFVDLEWQDLIPTDGGKSFDKLADGSKVQHGELASGFVQPQDTGIVSAYDNKTVRIPGFMVPVVNTAEGVTAFLLVPYVGACVHVPPPPANQIIFVTSREPYAAGTLFRAIRVTGLMETQSISTDLAEVGYVLDADHIELFEGQYG